MTLCRPGNIHHLRRRSACRCHRHAGRLHMRAMMLLPSYLALLGCLLLVLRKMRRRLLSLRSMGPDSIRHTRLGAKPRPAPR